MTTILEAKDWSARSEQYSRRVQKIIAPHYRRMRSNTPDPVLDFLFTYYSFKPSYLARWHPGFGITLSEAQKTVMAHYAHYCLTDNGLTVSQELLKRRAPTIDYISKLLSATEIRPAQLSCFGLHEWAMVYQSEHAVLRHKNIPLRLGSQATDAVVKSMNLRCTHFDAYRFFTPAALPLNTLALTREAQLTYEQPGCIHANMDLYKWSYKLCALIESEIIIECLELAIDARILDMRASPYDLSAHGYSPIKIEHPAGRADYVREQADLADRATRLRTALLTRCQSLLASHSKLTQ
ncbi:MAG: 3-methyladenine DNA glycosylase [Mycobacteriaceae bacterium]